MKRSSRAFRYVCMVLASHLLHIASPSLVPDGCLAYWLCCCQLPQTTHTHTHAVLHRVTSLHNNASCSQHYCRESVFFNNYLSAAATSRFFLRASLPLAPNSDSLRPHTHARASTKVFCRLLKCGHKLTLTGKVDREKEHKRVSKNKFYSLTFVYKLFICALQYKC